jgi:hypothetical protein
MEFAKWRKVFYLIRSRYTLQDIGNRPELMLIHGTTGEQLGIGLKKNCDFAH